MLWDLMRKMYRQDKMPKEWMESFIITIYKEKGEIHDCGHYRGIKLMPQRMKLWERIIEAMVRAETSIGEEQFGFMPRRITKDAIYALR